jgi:hypothetical protein
MGLTFVHFPDNLAQEISCQKIRRENEMANNEYRLTDEEFASFAKKYPSVKRSDIEELVAQKMFTDMAYRTQRSEIEFLKNKALETMGTNQEMSFSDIESGMLKASLSDGRQALKEILEKVPVETPSCNDGTKMKNQGRKKKHHDNTGTC